MSDSVDLIVTTKSDLREIIRDALADALRGQEKPAPELMSADALGKPHPCSCKDGPELGPSRLPARAGGP